MCFIRCEVKKRHWGGKNWLKTKRRKDILLLAFYPITHYSPKEKKLWHKIWFSSWKYEGKNVRFIHHLYYWIFFLSENKCNQVSKTTRNSSLRFFCFAMWKTNLLWWSRTRHMILIDWPFSEISIDKKSFILRP